MKRIMRLFPVVALLMGVFGIVATNKETIQADAIAIPSSTALYLKPNSDWLSAGARFAAYFYIDGGANEWKDLTKETGVQDIYKVISPMTNYTKIILTRMNPATTENNWTNTWNQTGNLDFDGTNDLMTLPAGWNVGTNTNWSVYDPLDHPLPPSFAADLPIYFKPSGTFMTGATSMAAYYFIDGETENEFVTMTEVDTGIYQAITPELVGKEYDRVIFVSMNGVSNWDNKVNQTGNLIYDGTHDMYDHATAGWITYTARPSVTLTATTEGITSSKVRIWLDRSGHYEDGYTWALKIGTTLYQPTGFEKALKLVGLDRYFPYYDMPTSVLTGNIGFSVINSFLKVDVEIPAVAYTAGDSNKVWKVDYVSEAWTITKGAITERIYNTFFAKVLEGYLTCDPNTTNGYMAFNALDTNFLPRASSVWNMEGDLTGNLIKDYVLESNYATGTRETVAATDAFAKYQRMQALYIIGSSTPGQSHRVTSNTANIGLIMAISLIGITAIAGFYFLKTKKQ